MLLVKTILVLVVLPLAIVYVKSLLKESALKRKELLFNYHKFISLLSSHRHAELVESRFGPNVHLRISSDGLNNFFQFFEKKGKLYVHWQMTSALFGTRTMQWNFKAGSNQEKIYSIILNDIHELSPQALNVPQERHVMAHAGG